MSKILFVDQDRKFLKQMQKHLGWCGFDIDILEESSTVIERLKKQHYDLLICDTLLEPFGSNMLIQMIRQTYADKIGPIKILLISQESLPSSNYTFIQKNNIYFLMKYNPITFWENKIEKILQN